MLRRHSTGIKQHGRSEPPQGARTIKKRGGIMCYKSKARYDNTAMAEAISECIHSELRREILHAVLIDGWTYERVAEKVDRSPRHVGRIIAQESPALHEWIARKMS